MPVGTAGAILGICEDDFGLRLTQLLRCNTFNCAGGSHGHKRGRPDFAVSRS